VIDYGNGSSTRINPTWTLDPNDPTYTGGPRNPDGSPRTDPPLSNAAIIGIAVACFLAFAMVVFFCLCRHWRAHRSERRRRWWRRIDSPTPDGTATPISPYRDIESSSDTSSTSDNRRESKRSSFGTSFDHSMLVREKSPSPPPMMAQVHRLSGGDPYIPVFLTGTPSPPQSPPGSIMEEKRFSIGSSASGDSEKEFRLVHHVRTNTITSMDISIRTGGMPLDSIAEESSAFSHETKSSTYSQPSVVDYPKPTIHQPESRSLSLTPPPIVRPPPAAVLRDPFSDPTTNSGPIPSPPQSIGYFNPSSTDHSTFDSHADPFGDRPYSTSSVSHAGHGRDIELDVVIQQPFVAATPDEITVSLGDRVVIVESLSDGWILVEKLSERGGGRERGIIPMVCLSDSDGGSVVSLL